MTPDQNEGGALTAFHSELGDFWSIKPLPGQITADVYHGHGGLSAEQLAHAMAAAPELLRCLENMATALAAAMDDESRDFFRAKISATHTAAAAAIAKARGK